MIITNERAIGKTVRRVGAASIVIIVVVVRGAQV